MISGKWPFLEEGAWSFASASDLHLGARRNDTPVMIEALDDGLIYSGLLDYIKLLVLAGDVFDKLLSLDDPCISHIDKWIARLLRECARRGVKLRILEGTPSHDRRQSQRFVTILEILGIELDFRYVTEVEIEHIEDLKVDVLYIPDEAHHTTIETKAVVEALLAARGLVQVDLGFMHGYFKHQLPYVTNEGSYHDLEFYSKIVRKWISIGHVHTRSRVLNALAQGSYDRHSHGEEESKGLMLATVGNTNDEAWFIDNPKAHVYRTLELYDYTVEDALVAIEQVAGSLPKNARLRLQAEPDHPIFQSMVNIQINWPELILTKHPKSRGEKTIAEKVLEDAVSKWVPVRFDKSNIGELTNARLVKKGLSVEHRQRLLDRLRECT